ncbi:unnamed protein product [Porites lobata]|uniref:Uncharacterized protein n=1 Tax=Porites lobata TaxID=104759 RepID=A0ABN8RRI6_9CNID|nr:unnamed protein product [Porites lobata]
MDGLAEDESCRCRPLKSVQEEDSLLVQSKPKSTQYKDNLEEKLEDLDSLSLNY